MDFLRDIYGFREKKANKTILSRNSLKNWSKALEIATRYRFKTKNLLLFRTPTTREWKNFIWSELAFFPQPLICTIGAMSNKLETIALCMDHWYTIQQITRSMDSMDQWITGIRLNSIYHKLLWQSWKSHHAITTSGKCQKNCRHFWSYRVAHLTAPPLKSLSASQ